MAISLSKGGNISLSKEDPNLEEIMVGLGWEARSTDGKPFDLDASAFLLAGTDKVRSDDDFCFYKQLNVANGAVIHQGDNLTGEGDGDDEQIMITLSKVPGDVNKIAVVVTIHDADVRKQSFGQVSGAFVRLVNNKTGNEITRFDLTEDMSTETAMILGEVYRNGADWKFRAVGQGYSGGLRTLALQYGVNVG